jgi:hypothetical protein
MNASNSSLKTPSDEYEKFVADIASSMSDTICRELGSTSKPTWGRENKVLGASGHQHQIDVSLDAGKYRFLVECKRYGSRPLSTDDLLTFAARKIDIEQAAPELVVYATMVSQRVVTRGAELIAKQFGIDLEVVEHGSTNYGMRLGKHVLSFVTETARAKDAVYGSVRHLLPDM